MVFKKNLYSALILRAYNLKKSNKKENDGEFLFIGW